jgi:hypothetical protein
MRLRDLVSLTIVGVMAAALSAKATANVDDRNAAMSSETAIKASADNISGDWYVSFEVEGMTVPGTFNLKLDGDSVTGKAYTDHTGPGTLSRGHYEDGKLSFTLDFSAHESILVTGSLKDGKLIGEFATEGRRGKWEATKNKPTSDK